MPLVLKQENPSFGTIFLWRINEPESFFAHNNDIRKEKIKEIQNWSESRRKEWLAGRHIINKYTKCTSRNLLVDNNGKPHVKDTGIEISVSHSHNFISLLVYSKPCGIDIQIERKNISKIAHKFCAQSELLMLSEFNSIEAQHIIWSTKEAIYKAYGRKRVDFLKHIHLSNFKKKQEGFEMNGEIIKGDEHYCYNVYGRKLDRFFMVCATAV